MNIFSIFIDKINNNKTGCKAVVKLKLSVDMSNILKLRVVRPQSNVKDVFRRWWWLFGGIFANIL